MLKRLGFADIIAIGVRGILLLAVSLIRCIGWTIVSSLSLIVSILIGGLSRMGLLRGIGFSFPLLRVEGDARGKSESSLVPGLLMLVC